MARTEGSGWGGGPLLYQICPNCKKKKLYYSPIVNAEHYKPYKCLSCKERCNHNDSLIKKQHPNNAGK